MQTLAQLQQDALEISKKYSELNRLNGHKPWVASDYLAGFVGDVGDLSKLVMAKNNLRIIDNVDDKLAHELADCLWSILVIADMLDVPLEQAFTRTMNELHRKLDAAISGTKNT